MSKNYNNTPKKEVIFPNFSLSQIRQSQKSNSGQGDSNSRPSAPKALEMFFKRFLRTIDITY